MNPYKENRLIFLGVKNSAKKLAKTFGKKEKAILADDSAPEDLISEEDVMELVEHAKEKIEASFLSRKSKKEMLRSLNKLVKRQKTEIRATETRTKEELKTLFFDTSHDLYAFTEQPEVAEIYNPLNKLVEKKEDFLRITNLEEYGLSTDDPEVGYWKTIELELSDVEITPEDIKKIQKILGLKDDGKVGPKTIESTWEMLTGQKKDVKNVIRQKGATKEASPDLVDAILNKDEGKEEEAKKQMAESKKEDAPEAETPTPAIQEVTQEAPTPEEAPDPEPPSEQETVIEENKPAPVVEAKLAEEKPATEPAPEAIAEQMPEASPEAASEEEVEITVASIDSLSSTKEGRAKIQKLALNEKGEFSIPRTDPLHSAMKLTHLYRDTKLWVNGKEAIYGQGKAGETYYLATDTERKNRVRIKNGDNISVSPPDNALQKAAISTRHPIGEAENKKLKEAFKYELIELAKEMPTGGIGMVVSNGMSYLAKRTTTGFTFIEKTLNSVAAKGYGETQDSFKTPRGLHKISATVRGDLGSVIKSKKVKAEKVRTVQSGTGDKITTVVLALEGLEDRNSNSAARSVYMHGTAQESLLGKQASHGCVRMANLDVQDLHDTVVDEQIAGREVYVYITETKAETPPTYREILARKEGKSKEAKAV